MELEHVIASCGASAKGTTFALPTTSNNIPSSSSAFQDLFAFSNGSAIVVSDASDPHNQSLIRGHHNTIYSIARSQNVSGRWIATGEEAPHSDVCVWENNASNDVSAIQIRFRLREHQTTIVSLSFSPDDTMLASLDASGLLIVMDLSNGGVVINTMLAPLFAKFGDSDASRMSVLFGPRAQDVKRRDTDEYHLALYGPGKIYLMKLNPYAPTLNGPIRTNLPTSQQSRVVSCAYTLTGDLVICGTESGEIFILHIESGAVVASTQGVCKLGARQIVILMNKSTQYSAEQQQFSSTEGFRYARFGPGSQRKTEFVVGSGDGTLTHCIIEDHNEPQVRVLNRKQIPLTSTSGVGATATAVVALSASESQTSSSSSTTTFIVSLSNGQVWKGSNILLSDEQQQQQQHQQDVNNNNNNNISRRTSGNNNQNNNGINNNNNNNFQLVSDSALASINNISTHPADPSAFITCTKDGAVTKWNLNSYLITHKNFTDPNMRFAHGNAPVCTCAQIVAGLDIQVSGWSDSCVRCHDFATGELLWSVTKCHRGGPVTSILVAPSLRFFLTGGEDGDIKCWDMRSRELKFVLSDHKQAVINLHLLGTEAHLISTSRDRTTLSWDMNRQRRITCHESFAGTTTAASVAKDECRVLVAGAGGTFDEFDLRQKERARQASYALYSPSNMPHIHGSDFDNVYDVSSAVAPFCTALKRAPQNIDACVNYFATGGSNSVVQVWDDRELRPVFTGAAGHSSAVGSVAYTCDGKQLISGGVDKAVLIWNLYDQKQPK